MIGPHPKWVSRAMGQRDEIINRDDARTIRGIDDLHWFLVEGKVGIPMALTFFRRGETR